MFGWLRGISLVAPMPVTSSQNPKVIYLGGGCFWCTEAVFQGLRGVSEVVPGYMGGTTKNPSYEQVSMGHTGHAEVIKVSFDEGEITTDDILDVFFATHDPTTLDQQGADQGTQYRSIIFYTDETMEDTVKKKIIEVETTLPEGTIVVTHVAAATDFYPAEEYHQNYYIDHGDSPYCKVVIDPKIEKLQKHFPDKLRE